MQVVGVTTQQEVMLGSRERNFRINEYVILQDPVQGDLRGEVVEARTYNRFIPLEVGGDFVDAGVLESLRAMGYDVDDETIYLAKVRLFNEALFPVLTGCSARPPHFEEVRDHLVQGNPKEGLLLGVIRNTDGLYDEMEEDLKDLLWTFEEGQWVEQREVPYFLNLRGMHQYPHIGVFGGSGSGKSFGLRVFLEELMKKKVPTLVLDPHYEMDFSDPSEKGEVGYFKDTYRILSIGEDIGVKFEHLTRGDIKNLLGAVAPLSEPMSNVVDVLFVKGNNLYSFKERIDDLLKVQDMNGREAILAEIEYSDGDKKKTWERRLEVYDKYDKKCHNQSVRGISWRLQNLEYEGIFNQDVLPVEESLQGGKLVVIQGSTRILNVFSTYLINHLYHLRREHRDGKYRGEVKDYFPPFVVVTDEAHNFAPKGVDTPAKNVLKEISQEGRKYGVFLILATQRPTLLDETITAQLNTKCIFRTVRASDIDTIREETDITSEEAKRLPYLRTGDVFISSSQMGRTIYGRIRGAFTESPHKENPFDELWGKEEEKMDKIFQHIKGYLPINEAGDLMYIIQDLSAKAQVNYGVEELKDYLKKLVQEGKLEAKENIFGNVYFDPEDPI
ncbi:MAG: ATP-binding protein [Tissierellia bacterium]|nr:ATP-binding protein [Tissierellia bacterium]